MSARILIVDDVADNRELLSMVLRSQGHTCVEADNGAAALDMIASLPVDVMLLDLMMPVMDGYAVLERLRAHAATRPLPVIVLTAHSDKEALKKALSLGANDFLAKPFDIHELKLRVANMLAFREALVLREHVAAQHRTERELCQLLGRAAEYRDNETGGHIKRMSRYARVIGEGAGLSVEDAELLLLAAPMHDVGKIAVPDAILHKPGKLTADEFETMKAHAACGYELLGGYDTPLMKAAASIALTHHEKYDGSGYPEGLAGEQIPLFGRLVAIADVYDALRSRRPYKEPMCVEGACDVIREGAGKHFDPGLVTIFFDRFDTILTIEEECRETL